jgi:hypothetical protein
LYLSNDHDETSIVIDISKNRIYHWGAKDFGMSDLLVRETKVFDDHHEQWLRDHPGEFVTIRDEEVAGFFGSYGDAFTAGLQRFGSSRSFLIRQIWQTEPAYFVF